MKSHLPATSWDIRIPHWVAKKTENVVSDAKWFRNIQHRRFHEINNEIQKHVI